MKSRIYILLAPLVIVVALLAFFLRGGSSGLGHYPDC